MSLKKELIAALVSEGDYVSGEKLSKSLFCSRNAVWKSVKALQAEGFKIESRPSVGYKLSLDDMPFCSDAVSALVGKEFDNLPIEVLDCVSSTNDSIKALASQGAPEGTIIVASKQTNGKGRLGRSFYSPENSGMYLSVLFRPSLSLSECLLITTAAAVAVAEAIEEVSGKKAEIKWVNDVFLDGKKVCGILTEASTDIEVGGLSWAVAGIGVNLTEPDGGFPDEIKDIAGAVFNRGDSIPKARLCAEIISRFMRLYRGLSDRTFLESYRERSFVLGKKINVLRHGETTPAKALEINKDCRLLVEYDSGETEWLSSGEVSIRPFIGSL